MKKNIVIRVRVRTVDFTDLGETEVIELHSGQRRSVVTRLSDVVDFIRNLIRDA